MTESEKPAAFDVIGTQPETQFEVRTLPEGSLLELSDGKRVRVEDNPRDGVWLVCETVDEDEQSLGEIEPVMCYAVTRLIRTGPADG